MAVVPFTDSFINCDPGEVEVCETLQGGGSKVTALAAQA